MSVLIFANTLQGISGLQKSLIETANLFDEKGHDVHIVNIVGQWPGFKTANPALNVNDNVKIHALQALHFDDVISPAKRLLAGYKLEQTFLKAKFTRYEILAFKELCEKLDETDAIIFTHPLQSVLYKLSGANSPARKLLQIHGNYIDETHNLDLLLESRDVLDIVQVVAPGMIHELSKASGIAWEKFVYIPNIHRPADVETTPDSKNVAIIGSLQDRKGQFDAVNAIARVQDPEVKLYIWGGTKGSYYDELARYVEGRGLSQRVVFCGVGQEKEIYRDTGLVIMTSRSEGFSYIQLESASHKIPMIFYDFNYGPRDFVEDGVDGFIVPYGDDVAMAEKIDVLMSDDDLRRGFGKKIHEKFVRKFSIENIYELYEKVLDLSSQKEKRDLLMINGGRAPARHQVPQMISFNARRLKKLQSQARPRAWQAGYVHNLLHGILNPGASKLDEKLQPQRKGGYVHTISMNIDSHEDGQKIIETHSASGSRQHVGHVRNGVLTAGINIPLTKHDGPEKYIAYLHAGEQRIYLFHTNLKGGYEISEEFEQIYPDFGGKMDASELFVSTNGLNVLQPDFELVRNIRNENNEEIKFQTIQIKRQGRSMPYVNVRGEYNDLYIHSNSGRITNVAFPRMSYKDIWSRIDYLEETHDLCNYKVGNVFPWELIRAPIIDLLMETYGNWSPLIVSGEDINLTYHGSKTLSQIAGKGTLLFEFVRKRGDEQDWRTDFLQNRDIAIIESPQSYGYTARTLDRSGNVFPIKQYLDEVKKEALTGAERYAGEFFERIFQNEFGVYINFPVIINQRIEKFVREYNWWRRFFSTRPFDEVIIPSAYWFPGIIRAAKDAGIPTADLQYAAICEMHPNYGFKRRKAYSADKIYVWSDYWALDTLPNGQKKILPKNHMTEQLAAYRQSAASMAPQYDFTVISQTRLRVSLLKFTAALARAFPKQTIGYALHPDDRALNDVWLEELFRCKNVMISENSTMDLIRNSRAIVGVYSTALYEAAAFGKPVYVIDLPGCELVGREIENGLFYKISSPEDIVPYRINEEVTEKLF